LGPSVIGLLYIQIDRGVACVCIRTDYSQYVCVCVYTHRFVIVRVCVYTQITHSECVCVYTQITHSECVCVYTHRLLIVSVFVCIHTDYS